MSHFSIHLWKRWLPVVVLLMILAQLASAAHWHQDEEPWVDCSLCLQSSTADDNHTATGSAFPHQLYCTQTAPAIVTQCLSILRTAAAIRAPPVTSIVKTLSA